MPAMAEDIAALFAELLTMNQLQTHDLHSVLLSATDDLPGGFSEDVIRIAGLQEIPVYTVQQFRYQANMDRCVQMICDVKQRMTDPQHLLLGCESWGEES